MPEEKEDVKTEESSTPEEQEQTEQAEDTATATPEQEPTEPTKEDTKPTPSEDVDEYGVPWKNRFMEQRRKNEELVDKLPNMIEETLSKRNTSKPEYTISQLEQYAIENPQYRPWVEERKAEIIQGNVSKVTEAKIKEIEQRQKADNTRQQSYEWATKNPRLQEAFVTDSYGRKIFNQAHPLSQMISRYMSDATLAQRPDALVIASKLALADYLDYKETTSRTQNQKLKASLKKVQKQTMVEGGGVKPAVSASAFKKAQERLRQSGNKSDAKDAVAEYLRSVGVIQE